MTGNQASVRAARRQDLPGLVHLRVHYLGETAHLEPRLPIAADARARTEQILPVWLGQEERVLLVAEGPAPEGVPAPLVGYATGVLDVRPPLLLHQRVGEVLECYVEPPWRGRGVGARLLDVLGEALRGRGAEVVRAAVPVRNEVALERFRRRGFRPLQWIMDRRLDAV